jgi:N-acetylmuramic acid 6-phosphate etherase
MNKNKQLFDQLRRLTTELRNPRTLKIDRLSIPEILESINREERTVTLAVRKEIRHIARAVEFIVKSLRSGGRLIYVGAGTSGRLGILDASECPPTFGTSPETVQGIIAGGTESVFRSREGAEDHEKDGMMAIQSKRVGKKDVVCGITASARTPFVVGAVKEAKRRGASTVYVTTNPRSILRKPDFAELRRYIDIAICPDVGPEVIMGSTRMKSGTAQKLVLNMLTTAAMIRLGKVYENMMIDLKMTSRKLQERAKRVVMIATGVDYETAAGKLAEAGGHVKTALVMIKAGLTAKKARERLKKAGGFVHLAIRNMRYSYSREKK